MGGCAPRVVKSNSISTQNLGETLLNENYYKRRKEFLKIQDKIKKYQRNNTEFKKLFSGLNSINETSFTLKIEDAWEMHGQELSLKDIDKSEVVNFTKVQICRDFIKKELVRKTSLAEVFKTSLSDKEVINDKTPQLHALSLHVSYFNHEIDVLEYDLGKLKEHSISQINIWECLNFDNDLPIIVAAFIKLQISHPLDEKLLKTVGEFVESNKHLKSVKIIFEHNSNKRMGEKEMKVIDFNLNKIYPLILTACRNNTNINNFMLGFCKDIADHLSYSKAAFFEILSEIASNSNLLSFGLYNFIHIPKNHLTVLTKKISLNTSIKALFWSVKSYDSDSLESIIKNSDITTIMYNPTDVDQIKFQDNNNVIFMKDK